MSEISEDVTVRALAIVLAGLAWGRNWDELGSYKRMFAINEAQHTLSRMRREKS